jgi:hypothetical protein
MDGDALGEPLPHWLCDCVWVAELEKLRVAAPDWVPHAEPDFVTDADGVDDLVKLYVGELQEDTLAVGDMEKAPLAVKDADEQPELVGLRLGVRLPVLEMVALPVGVPLLHSVKVPELVAAPDSVTLGVPLNEIVGDIV